MRKLESRRVILDDRYDIPPSHYPLASNEKVHVVKILDVQRFDVCFFRVEILLIVEVELEEQKK